MDSLQTFNQVSTLFFGSTLRCDDLKDLFCSNHISARHLSVNVDTIKFPLKKTPVMFSSSLKHRDDSRLYFSIYSCSRWCVSHGKVLFSSEREDGWELSAWPPYRMFTKCPVTWSISWHSYWLPVERLFVWVTAGEKLHVFPVICV